MPKVARYGSWVSPFSADSVARGGVGLGQVCLDGEYVYWVEGRPSEGGRNTVVRLDPDGAIEDQTPGFNARNMVHEYGGGDFTVAAGALYFSNFSDQRLYRKDPGGETRPITPEGKLRYAEPVVDGTRGRLICVREDHTESDMDCVNQLVGVPSSGEGSISVLAGGRDFYSSAKLSPDGRHLAWLEWDHPNMPWDGTELKVAEISADGSLSPAAAVAGGRSESIFQPEWSPGGVMHFVSDRTGWWNLYRWRDGSVEALCPMPAEFGKPQWVFGINTFAFDGEDRILCQIVQQGAWRLAVLEGAAAGAPRLRPLDLPYVEFGRIAAAAGRAYFAAASPSEPVAVVAMDIAGGETQVLRRSREDLPDPGLLSLGRPIEFESADGARAFAIYYPPANLGYSAPPDEAPPLMVAIHGGPTSMVSPSFSPGFQYFTSRGIAVVDVNYRGSTGYGRPFRDLLKGAWGVADVEDAIAAARHLVDHGLADPNRVAIRGGSAGGYTTLAALAFEDYFRAGCSLFGISDLRLMDADTHKFESRYCLEMIGGPDNYDLRSPIHRASEIRAPLLLLQGLDDRVVPPNQAEVIVAELHRRGVPYAYIAFEGEGHGFRKAENIARSLEAELYFYSQVFDFALAGEVEPVEIENL